jgi:hypothetical protein
MVSMGGTGKAYKILVRNPEGKRPLGRSRRKWKNNITKDLKNRVEISALDRDW